MKEHKLISTTDFVLEQAKLPIHRIDVAFNSIEHAKKLKRELKKSMFVPTDEDGDVLEEPSEEFKIKFFQTHGLYSQYEDYKNIYSQAKKQAIFEGFDLIDDDAVSNGIISITFNNLITLMINGFSGHGGLSVNKMAVEDLIEYDLIINDNF